jgi:hypothetical protein
MGQGDPGSQHQSAVRQIGTAVSSVVQFFAADTLIQSRRALQVPKQVPVGPIPLQVPRGCCDTASRRQSKHKWTCRELSQSLSSDELSDRYPYAAQFLGRRQQRVHLDQHCAATQHPGAWRPKQSIDAQKLRLLVQAQARLAGVDRQLVRHRDAVEF